MRIVEVGFSGFKGTLQPKAVVLSGMDVFTGPNGAGKSTILEAIMVAMRGHNPAWGASNQITYSNRNIDARNLWAGITLDVEPFEVAFSLTKPEKSIKEQVWIGKEYHPPIRGKELRDEAIGNFPVMFNLKEFLDLSANKRKSFILSLLPKDDALGSAVDLELAIAKRALGGDVYLAYEEAASDQEHLLVLVRGKCGEAWKDFRVNVVAGADPMSFKIPPMDELAAAARRFLLDKRAELRGARESLREVGVKEFVTPEELARLKRGLGEIEERLGGLQKKHGEAEEARRQYEEREGKIASLGKKQENLKKIMNDSLGDQLDIKELHALVAEVEKEVKRLERFIELGKIHRRSLGATDELLAAAGAKCPVCRHDLGPDEIDALRAEIVGKSSASLTESASDMNKLVNVREELRDLQDRVARYETASTARGVHLDAQRNLQGLSPDFADPYQLSEEIKRLCDDRSRMNDDLKDKAAAAEAAKFRANVESSIARLEGRIEYYKAADDACQDHAMLPLVENVSAIQESITALLVSIDPGLEFVFELDAKSRLLMGLRRDGSVIPYSALSGGEQVLVGCALVVGLVKMADPKLKVLAVEASEVDGERIQALLTGLGALKGHLDNILVATHLTVGSPDGWKVHRLSKEGEFMPTDHRLFFAVHESGTLIQKGSLDELERAASCRGKLIFEDTPEDRIRLLTAAMGAGATVEAVTTQAAAWDNPFTVGNVGEPASEPEKPEALDGEEPSENPDEGGEEEKEEEVAGF